MYPLEFWAGLADSRRKEKWLDLVRNKDREIGAFLEITDPLPPRKNGVLAGVPFAVKDNIMVDGLHCTCGSKLLANVVASYTATAVERLMNEGAVVAGKTNLDEFGMGSSTDNSGLQETENPWKPGHVPGGSSGGSAAAVAAGYVSFALGSDTGGSVRQPASFCGVYGLKPTYGSVSRFGLVAYASSLEVIGVCSGTVETAEKVFSVMRGLDSRDQTSADLPADYKKKEVRTIGVLADRQGLHESVGEAYHESMRRLEKLGYRIIEAELPVLEYVIPAYYTIAMAEASANLARFDGVRYGVRARDSKSPVELMQKSRDAGFGDEVKLRILCGTYVLRSGFQDQYYHRAQKIRTAIRNGFDRVFNGCDAFLMPVSPVPAFPHNDDTMNQFQQKLADKYTATANLTGNPAFAFPVEVYDGLPVGMQLMAPQFCEDRLFAVTAGLEQEYPPLPCPARIKREDLA
ncbi:MAG: Asp-tRNA(Asn)/Glu-tRNA(Gln) amidotransferase subunit GatA [Spirochaetales bacterium]|nr:Asp-tRNA(Asn)/Glu-tRNA(Gln) amidotransferase subunit GatA [Spirochaetales bacterium]